MTVFSKNQDLDAAVNLIASHAEAVVYDMDGVLVDADRLHYDALNAALALEKMYITYQQHIYFFKGLPTKKKLRILEHKFNREPGSLDYLNDVKQQKTLELIEVLLQEDPVKIDMMRRLRANGVRVGVASNAIRQSVEKMLKATGVLEYVEEYMSNEDVARPKPAPDVYLNLAAKMGINIERTIIVEDSEVGRMSGREAKGILCAVDGPEEVTLHRLAQTVQHAGKMRIVIPMAGYGKRFIEAGYAFPKPLIDVDGKPMIQRVIENVAVPNAFFIFIVQAEHRKKYALDMLLNRVAPGCEIIEVDKVTEGAACTVLLAKNFIDDQNELLIANSDQLVDVSMLDFITDMRKRDAAGGIMTFPSTHPKWSYARLDGSDWTTSWVTEVREKEPISEYATVGIYYFKRGCDYVSSAQRMIEKDVRVNGEFYVCPVYNELIERLRNENVLNGVAVWNFSSDMMHGTGVPDDLQAYLLKRSSDAEYRRVHP